MSALLSYVSAHPWCLHEPTLNAFRSVLMRHLAGERVTAEDLAMIQASRDAKHGAAQALHKECAEQANGGGDSKVRYAVRGSVAVVPVTGVIARLSSQVNGTSQPKGTSLESLNATLDAIQQDSRVASVLMYVDSPGGYGDGLEAMGNRLASFSKPLYAFGESLVASAAYWLGSQSKEFKVALGTDVGSIGTYAVVDDYSKLYAMRGITTEVIKSAPHKGDFIEGAPVTQEMKDNLQREINAHSDRFKAAVARGRSRAMTPEQVNAAATGQVWPDSDAVAKGLADGVTSLDQYINELNQRHAPQSSAWATAATKPLKKEAPMGAELQDKAGAAPTAGGETISFEAKKAEFEAKAKADAKTAADAAAKDERERVLAIHRYAGMAGVAVDSEVVKKAIEGGLEPEKALASMLESKGENTRPLGLMDSIEVGATGQQRQLQDHTLAMVSRQVNLESILSPGEDRDAKAKAAKLARSLGYSSTAEAISAVHRVSDSGMANMRLMDHAQKLTRGGERLGSEALIQASFVGQGSSQFPNLLSNVAKKLIIAGAAMVPTFWRSIAIKGSATDFKSAKRIRLSEIGSFQRAQSEQAEPRITGLDENGESIALETDAMTFGLTRQAMYNDDLNGFARLPLAVGRAAERRPDELLCALLASGSGLGPTLSDGATLFHANHGNILTSAALAFDAVQTAITAFMERTMPNSKDNAVPIDVMPKTLLVPSNLLPTAEEICYSPTKPTSSQANPALPNFVQRQGLMPIGSARLKSLVSSTRWWLFADPNEYPVLEVLFLNGNESPEISELPRTNPQQITWTALFDCNVGAIDSIGAATNAGT